MATSDIPNFGDGLSEGMKAGEFSGREVFQTVNNSLSQPLDVRAAHQYFSPSGNSGLPDLQTFSGDSLNFSNQSLNFNAGSELAFNSAHNLAFEAAPMAQMAHMPLVPTGAEAAAFAPGADAAIAALTPGAEPISPIIQLIMRMPGHIGLISSFFEALGALFMPLQEFISAFNPFEWLNRANEGLISSMSTMGEHLPMSLSLLPANAPIFATLGQSLGSIGMGNLGTNMMTGQMTGLGDMASAGTAGMGNLQHFGDIPQADLNVGGHADFSTQPTYETTGADIGNPHDLVVGDDFMQHQQLAFDNGGSAFRPQLGGMQGNSSNIPQAQIPQQPAPQVQPSAGQHVDMARPQTTQPQAADQQSLLKPEAAGQQVAQSPSEASAYTVKPGDNLWDIARNNLGDGTKWQDIYKLNQDVVGGNPALIHPGAQLNLGDGSHITANADYTVKPGDNLWDISKDHMGGGQNWHHLYEQNTNVIGDNPSLIHPGQQLHMTGGEHHATLADSSGAHHAASHNMASHNATASHTTAHHSAPSHDAQTAHHSGPQNHSAPQQHGQHAADKMASAKPAAGQPPQAVEASSHQVPQQLAQTPQGGVEQGLKASQTMGSLKELKLTE